jgi:spore maturation protein CgeB
VSRPLRLAYLAHSLRSDWNNGNAHFLRGLLRALGTMGHDVRAFEPCTDWSIEHLREEERGESSLARFNELYPDLNILPYRLADALSVDYWHAALSDRDVVILHEWNPAPLAQLLLDLRDQLEFRLLFHDTHHRASSSPEQIRALGTDRFDGVLCFGESLREIYRDRFGIAQSWTLHEAADTTVFRPNRKTEKNTDVVWIGNWGDGERTREIRTFLLEPAAGLPAHNFAIYGVRYPEDGLGALRAAGIRYGGYLPNLEAPAVYAEAQATVHIPRQQYTAALCGVPTVRVFEALACGIPLVSAPWRDTEHLFREGDFLMVKSGEEMKQALRGLVHDHAAADAQALRGLETILARHTCRHRAEELTCICEELLG